MTTPACQPQPRWMAHSIVVVLLGCDTRSDRERYIAALAEPHPTDLSACTEIETPDLKGDCQLALAGRMAPLAQWCPHIDDEPWHSECWFSAAEGARDARRWAEAVSLCDRSTRFVDACLGHLWQPQLTHILRTHAGQDFTFSVAAVQRVHDDWMPLIGERLTEPLWFHYARGVFRRTTQAPITWCEQLPIEHRALCQDVHQQLATNARSAQTP